MDWTRVIIVFLGAPFLYFGVGLPWTLLGQRPAWAPVWGLAVLGFAVELAYMGGLPVSAVVAGVVLVHGLAVAGMIANSRERRAELAGELAMFVRLYLIALIPFVVAPFSTPGLWTGDWLLAFEGATHLRQGLPLYSDLLARPPLFGAAGVPLLVVAPDLRAFQVFCAIASAAGLQAFRLALQRPLQWGLVWILAASPFFLQVTLHGWPKFLCAAFLLAAWYAVELPGFTREVVFGLFAGFALATHQSAILFAPLLAFRLYASAAGGAGGIRRLAVAAILVLAIAAPWELYTWQVYGWDAKVHANPAVSMRLKEIPGWLNALLVGVTTFISWGPLYVAWHWLKSPDRFTLARIAHELYWLATSLGNGLAGCLLGIVLPWWLALGGADLKRRLGGLCARFGWQTWLALGLALLGQMVLNPFYLADGIMPTGWVPVGVALAIWLGRELADAPGEPLKAVLKWTICIGTAPWLALQLALTAGLAMNERIRGLFFDTDLQSLKEHGWTTLALGGFPWVQGLAGAVGWFTWRRTGRTGT